MQTKLIIFDCDGVLVDSERISCRVFTQLMHEEGVEVSEDQVYNDLVGGSMQKSIAYVESKLGYTLERSDFTQKYRDRSFKAYQEELQPVAGVKDLIKTLDIAKCVGSNGPREKIKLNLKLTELDTFFPEEHIFSAYDIKTWKPDPALFLFAAEQMGFSNKEVLVVEDSRNGILAANAAGMRAVAYHPGLDNGRFSDLDCTIISDMAEINAML